MLPQEESLGKSMEGKSWPEIAAMARAIQIRLEHEDEDAKKLEAQLRVIKQSLIEHMEHTGMDARSTELHGSLAKLLDSMEEQLMRYDIERHEFISFLRTLLEKLRSRKDLGGKPHRAEFSRHKK